MGALRRRRGAPPGVSNGAVSLYQTQVRWMLFSSHGVSRLLQVAGVRGRLAVSAGVCRDVFPFMDGKRENSYSKESAT